MTPVAIMDSWIIVWHFQVTLTIIHLDQGCIISHSDIHFLYLWILCWSNYNGFIDSWITPPNDIDNYPLRWRLQKREGTMLHYYLTFPHSHYLTTHSDKGILVAEGPFHKVLERCQICKKKWVSHPPHIIFEFRKCSSPHLVGCLSTWGVVQRARMPVYKDMLLGYKMKQRQRTIIGQGMKWWLGCHSGCVTWSSAPMMLL